MPRLTRHVLALAAACLVVLSASIPALAHAELDFTLPAEGASVGEPVAEIRIAFTEPVTLVGPGFRVLTPQGVVVEPFAVTDDDIVFRLQLDPPLVGGAVGVQYEVAAADGHVLQGSYAFTVLAEALPTTVPPTVPPTVPSTAEPPATAATTPGNGSTVPATAGNAVTAEPVLVVAAPTTAAAAPPVAGGNDDGQSQRSLVIAVAAAVAAAALGFVIVRSRRHPA